jgi:hypothetical protein
VAAIIDLLDPLLGQMGVDLRGTNISVTQHLLHRTEIRAVLQQMGGEGMAEGMGGDLLMDTRFFGVSFDDLPKPLTG